MRRVAIALAVLVLVACGGEPAPEPVRPAQSSGAELSSPRGRGMEVSGLMGTIPEREIHAALEAKLGGFQRCLMRGAEQVELIAGRMEFYFRVGLDGRVEWVFPRASSIGHRETELCLLEVAGATRFPEPQGGGAAEVAWSFEIDVPEDVRPPVAWDASEIDPVLVERGTSLEGCGLAPGALGVTAYVAPGGRVLAAGAAAGSREATAQIDCALAAIAAWPMPDPGSYPAKVSFSAP